MERILPYFFGLTNNQKNGTIKLFNKEFFMRFKALDSSRAQFLVDFAHISRWFFARL